MAGTIFQGGVVLLVTWVGGWRLGLWRPNPSASLSGGGMSETLGLKLRNLELSCLMVWLSIRFFLLELKEVCSPIYNYEL